MRQASGDPGLDLLEPPTAINLRATVVALRLRSTVAELNTPAVLRFCDSTANAIRQAVTMGYLTARGYPTVRVLLAGTPGDALGGTWLLTERVDRPWTPPRGVGRLTDAVHRVRVAWHRPTRLADLSARLHAIEPEPLQYELAATGAGLDWYRFQWPRAHMISGPGSDQVFDWLERHRPADSKAAISHGDLHHDNVVDGADGVRVVDWEIVALAPPARDIACTMLAMTTTYCAAPRPVRPLTAAIGRTMTRRFLRAYRSRCPAELPDDELAWHRVLYSLNRLFWARRANDEEGGSDDPAIIRECRARDLEIPVHLGIVRDITGVDLRHYTVHDDVSGLT